MSLVILKKQKRAERKREYWKDPEFIEKERKRDNERKKRKRIEESVRKEALLYWQKSALPPPRPSHLHTPTTHAAAHPPF